MNAVNWRQIVDVLSGYPVPVYIDCGGRWLGDLISRCPTCGWGSLAIRSYRAEPVGFWRANVKRHVESCGASFWEELWR